MIFDNCTTRTKQGDVGEARAIYEYTKLGHGVSRTLFDSEKYDLVIDDGERLKRVQVRTCSLKTTSGGHEISLTVSGGNTKTNTRRLFSVDDYDILFVLTGDDRCWSIPVNAINTTNSITVGSKGPGSLYHEFELNVDSPYVPPQSNAKIYTIDESVIVKCAKSSQYYTEVLTQLEIPYSSENIRKLKSILDRHLIVLQYIKKNTTNADSVSTYFTKEQLQQMVWEMPFTKIGEKYGVTDNAIRRWVKKWNVDVPPRGHFLKKEQTGQVNTYLKTI